MRRLLRWLGYQFACAAVWCDGAAARVATPEEKRAFVTARWFAPVVTDGDKPIDFSMQPVEYQRMAVGCLYTLAPMRWPRRARA